VVDEVRIEVGEDVDGDDGGEIFTCPDLMLGQVNGAKHSTWREPLAQRGSAQKKNLSARAEAGWIRGGLMIVRHIARCGCAAVGPTKPGVNRRSMSAWLPQRQHCVFGPQLECRTQVVD